MTATVVALFKATNYRDIAQSIGFVVAIVLVLLALSYMNPRNG